MIFKASSIFQVAAQILNTGTLMQIVECFKILNVSPGEDWRKVRKSYHSLARQFHPDVNPEKRTTDPQQSDTRLKEINQAFEKLETHYKSNVLPAHPVSLHQNRNSKKWVKLFNRLKENPAVQRAFTSSLSFLVDLDSKVFQLDNQIDIKLSESTIQKGASIHLKSGKDRFEIKVPSGDWNQMSLRIPDKGESSIFSKRRGDLVLNLSVPVQKITSAANSRFSYEMNIQRNQIDGGRVMTLNSSEGPLKFTLPRNTQDGQSFTLHSQREGLGKPGTLHILTVRLN
ncbi:MAG: DnaJ domain-containing protein [Nitrospina sp.]|nr:DnaJ domain-containing protein [Nitrospina sp.]MBT7709786.1 DnaJ domain-containing protein [Nitrospina sp.]